MSETESYWWYITLKGPSGQGEVLRSLAEASGCIGSEEEDRSSSVSVELRAYYRSNHDLGDWMERLAPLVTEWPDISVHDMGKIENRQWYALSLEAFPPLNVGERFVVLAPWHRGKEPEDRIPLYINPGSAFGTGYHESTQNVLILMERYFRPGITVADIGCGSAILSIAAVKLGAETVYARDVDPSVMTEAVSNIALNDLDQRRILLEEGDLLDDFDHAVDLLVANILLDPLLNLIPRVASALKPSGIALFSGLTLSERERFEAGLSHVGLSIIDEVTSDQWLGLAVTQE
ncbi:MAG: 50S ribosomal protein L11 methyltransferase [Dethiosulfovibrio peptidovorans]|nr:MAG: 50S ribosomal protein L11 methyltransferase [Dethiosulfovibrio peptidovorans]